MSFNPLFKGSELVVAGKTGNSNISPHVSSVGVTGGISFNTTHTEPVGSLERLWAYLTVKQILAERELATDKTELTKKALDLSLKYSFVTEVSSLVVIKPDDDFSSRVYDSNAPTAPQVSLGAAGKSGQRRRGPMGGYCMHRKSPQPPTTPFPGVLSTTRRQPIPTTAVTHEPDHSSVPQWLDDLRNTNANITTPQGTFKLGQSGVVNVFPSCEKTPVGGSGECKIIFDCPQVFLELTNMNVYLQYFCPLNEFAGVCCPGASGNSTSSA